MSTDLHTPLGLNDSPPRWWARIPFGVTGGILIATVMSGLAIWAKFQPDPFGGDPVAVIRVDKGKTGVGPKNIGVAGGTVDHGASAAGHDKPTEHAAAPAHGDSAAADHGAPPAAGDHGAAPAAEAAAPPRGTPRPGLPADGQILTSLAVARNTEQNGKYGPMPKVAPDGARPMEVYARPPAKMPAMTPKVVLVVGGLGLSQTGTQEALRLLSPEVTLAFSPYGSALDRWVARARQDGHEVLIQVPMEPFDFPDNDPGPQTLRTDLPQDENVDRLRWVLSRITTYVGVVNFAGGKFTSSEQQLQPIMREIASRGLLYLDDGSSTRSMAMSAAKPASTPFARAEIIIDSVVTEADIDARLAQLEGLARQNGIAIGYATALPVSMRRISEWTKGLEARGVVVVPISTAVRETQG